MDSFAVVAEAFGLPYSPKDPSNQDWELMVGDSRRTSEFLDGYQRKARACIAWAPKTGGRSRDRTG